jgi:hypothetical protein
MCESVKDMKKLYIKIEIEREINEESSSNDTKIYTIITNNLSNECFHLIDGDLVFLINDCVGLCDYLSIHSKIARNHCGIEESCWRSSKSSQ